MIKKVSAAGLAVLLSTLVAMPVASGQPRYTAPHGRSASGCAAGVTRSGRLQACPDRGPVGTTVTLSGRGCHGPGAHTVRAVFLGPKAYIGSAGGGVAVDIPVRTDDHFRGTFTIPASYRTGGDAGTTVPVQPGSGYSFGVYPAGICHVGFVVTGTAAPLASTGPVLPPTALAVGAIFLILSGMWLARSGRRVRHNRT